MVIISRELRSKGQGIGVECPLLLEMSYVMLASSGLFWSVSVYIVVQQIAAIVFPLLHEPQFPSISVFTWMGYELSTVVSPKRYSRAKL